MPPATLWTAALLCVAGAFFGHANPLLHVPAAVLAFPAGLALAAWTTGDGRAAFRRGLLVGWGAAVACLYWVAVPLYAHGGFPLPLALPAPVLLGLCLGLYAGLYCWFLRLTTARSGWLAASVMAALAFALTEHLRGVLFTGFPWLTLASAWAPWPGMLQTAHLWGGLGLTALTAWIGTLAALAWLGQGLRPLALAALLVVLLAGYGQWRLASPQPEAPSLTVAMVQGNVDQGQKWDPAFQNGTVARYLTLSRRAVDERAPDLLVWPETALPFYFQERVPLSLAVRDFALDANTPLIVGAPGYEMQDAEAYRLYNRVFYVSAMGHIADHYDKQHLVPFGEYVPMGRLLPFMDKLVEGGTDFSAGHDPSPLSAGVAGLDAEGAQARLGVLVCYEAIFPDLVRRRVAAGANLLVNVSNDAWFGRTSAPVQHLHLALVRAVEQNRWLVRATNTGISALVDPRGRVTARGGLYRAEVVSGPVGLTDNLTAYHRLGPWMPWFMALAAAALYLLDRRAQTR